MKRLLLSIATFAGIGYLPLAPGTWASLVVTLVAWFVITPATHVLIPALSALLIYGIGIPAAYVAIDRLNHKDPRPCVIDEVAGQLLALTALPHTGWVYAMAFFFFRVFDVIKPFPVRQSERLPGGWGIMSDDMLAGLYALGCSHAILAILSHWH